MLPVFISVHAQDLFNIPWNIAVAFLTQTDMHFYSKRPFFKRSCFRWSYRFEKIFPHAEAWFGPVKHCSLSTSDMFVSKVIRVLSSLTVLSNECCSLFSHQGHNTCQRQLWLSFQKIKWRSVSCLVSRALSQIFSLFSAIWWWRGLGPSVGSVLSHM